MQDYNLWTGYFNLLYKNEVPMQDRSLWTGYFPILIQLCDSKRKMICNLPDDVPNGVAFNVLQCNVEVMLDYQI